MGRPVFPLLAILTLLGVPAVVSGQEDPPAEPFERRYIDAASRRSDAPLLVDWPELNRLVRWSRAVESAVAEPDSGIPGELLAAFRARVDSLARAPMPGFLAARRDSVRATIDALTADLDAAEAALKAPPAEVRPTGGEAENAPSRQRTLVTGGTAVTVPAGVAVGGRDSLPTAEFAGGPSVNPIDRVADALAELDRLVHLTRTAGAPPAETAAPPR